MKNHYKFWIVLSFVIVFLAGIFGGIILEDKVLDNKTERQARSTRRGTVRFPTLDDMAAELGLNSMQQEKIQMIFHGNEQRLREFREEIHSHYSKLRIQLLNEIKNVLTEEQTKKFDSMIERYLSQRKEAKEKRNRKTQDDIP